MTSPTFHKGFDTLNTFALLDGRDVNARGLITVQDWEPRARITPLFQFRPEKQERVQGVGTAFRVGPHGWCITAFHVIHHLFKESFDEILKDPECALREDLLLTSLQPAYAVFGSAGIPKEQWRQIETYQALLGGKEKPLSPRKLVNLNEFSALNIPRIDPKTTQFFPIKMKYSTPKIGDRLMCLGYADLDLTDDRKFKKIDEPLDDTLYACFGNVTEITKLDMEQGEGWPKAYIDIFLPSGMSGGPVFNEEGHVIGVISKSMEGNDFYPPISSIALFDGAVIPDWFLPALNRENPNWFKGFATFNDDGSLKEVWQVGVDVGSRQDWTAVDFNPITGDYLTRQLKR